MNDPLAAARRALSHWPQLASGSCAPLGRGLIHATFAVHSDAGHFVLQRVNAIFTPEVHLDITAVTERLAAAGLVTTRLVMPTPATRPWIENEDGVWRVLTRIEGHSFSAVQSPAQAAAAAQLLARVHSALEGMPHAFVAQRAGVHDTAAHLHALVAALEEHPRHRLFAEVAPLAADIMWRAAELVPIDGVPARIVHGDPKLDNVIFAGAVAPASETAVAWIDLDTVGPMALAYELGDAWRSWCNPRGEDQAGARFDLALFEASLSAYARACTLPLSRAEIDSLATGPEWITLELAARFAADALRESYFGWDRTRFSAAGEHNLVRARGQWSLHQAVMDARAGRERALRAAFP